MVKAKRVVGTRPAPEHPPLSEGDYKPYLVEAVQKIWSLEEAAFYIHERKPQIELLEQPEKLGKIGQIYDWLVNQNLEGQLIDLRNRQPPLFSPGKIMRYLWEKERHFSPRVWALYDIAEKGLVPKGIKSGVSRSNYRMAADLVRERFPNVTKVELIRFLMTLPDRIKGEGEIAYFAHSTHENLSKIIKNPKFGRAGRPKAADSVLLEAFEDDLVRELYDRLIP
ncbi:MAG: hypothetical protein DI586_05305 [Micavibrio aeruginosavorus]|uniref:Uncharacterized protein n=1 Tax=Micavibrio aeruginosavorus TaxID=349221 RepID=A0A2W5FQ60_9BACT|nr:MAG: hypothetical protein DI586_05305 [Micavibrio aeruginosavorus]